ncbi:hypothetical protein VOLCADRAFT_76641 [Volvox carteri f. nagariensis]|uniref:Uncharacterized protein n=1 Tax=Volvox carteri f. nagariensis TaxID=3068 RepID=D8U9D9_VOLCA|nr:uncharacterized protein VOLCADRAFT_76641 [Volvox carteri f. nagariensis]EFJ43566.1 hypothetical protein VOLCADRAFT_76641 [Volvox carteri f. nagariensis]|eukprot:XP_002955266.1 hypothetical protein VOLCADRAFT_76641 [Volvox carteri f. nagariensis]
MTSLLVKPCSLLCKKSSFRTPVPFSVGALNLQRTSHVLGRGHRVCPGRSRTPVRASSDDGKEVVYNKEFGYSRKDVLIITFGLIALGYALYYGLQAMGMEAGYAGNWVQLIIFMGICVGWISTYIYRVATKQMTYVKQLEQYEEAVMQKRVEEMTEAEMAELANEVEADRQRRRAGRAAPKLE